MPGKRKATRLDNLREIRGHPGLYTFVDISHNSKKERALLAKIVRDARKLREQTYVARIASKAST